MLKQQGAIIVDPADIPSVVDKDREEQLPAAGTSAPAWTTCKGKDEDCSVVFKYGMKRDFNEWLQSLGAAAPVKTLTELRAVEHRARRSAGAIKYGQSQLDISDEMDVETDRARYEADRAKDIALAGDARHRRGDEGAAARRAALSRPRAAPAIAAQARLSDGDRAVRAWCRTRRRRRSRDGFDAKPAPFGVSFTGMACSEPTLLELAYAFEQATKKRVPPPLP